MDPDKPRVQYTGGTQQSPYDFIFNPPKRKRSWLSIGRSPRQRIVFICGGIVAVLVVFALIFSLLSSGGNARTKALTEIAQQQQELIRVASLATKDSRSRDTLAFAENVRLSSISAQTQTTTYLASKHVKLKTKDLALKQNAATDTTLKAAATAGRFDDAFNTVLRNELMTYQKQVQTEYNATKSDKAKTMLKAFYDQSVILLRTTTVSPQTETSS